MLPREHFQFRHSGHGAVVVHDLADDPGRFQAGKTGQVNGAFSLAKAYKHSAFAGSERENMTGADQVFGTGIIGNSGHNREGPISCRNAGGNTMFRLDRYGECRLKGRRVVTHHRSQS